MRVGKEEIMGSYLETKHEVLKISQPVGMALQKELKYQLLTQFSVEGDSLPRLSLRSKAS